MVANSYCNVFWPFRIVKSIWLSIFLPQNSITSGGLHFDCKRALVALFECAWEEPMKPVGQSARASFADVVQFSSQPWSPAALMSWSQVLGLLPTNISGVPSCTGEGSLPWFNLVYIRVWHFILETNMVAPIVSLLLYINSFRFLVWEFLQQAARGCILFEATFAAEPPVVSAYFSIYYLPFISRTDLHYLHHKYNFAPPAANF